MTAFGTGTDERTAGEKGGETHAGVTNAISFDLEHWYTATLVRDAVTDPTDHVEESVDRVRELLDEFDVRATFFVVGELAREHPDLIGSLAADGHEIASHGHTHTPLFDLDRESFRRELTASDDAIADAAGVSPVGFRAPNFSIARSTEWAFDVLEDVGFEYDSSVFPVRTPMYGVGGAPVGPYRSRAPDRFSAGGAGASDESTIDELPVAVHPRWRVPVAGGFYARLLPTRVVEWGIRALNRRGLPAVLYFHPWEFNPDVRSGEPPLSARFVSYHNVDSTGAKLARLLDRFEFETVAACRSAHLSNDD
ncbi:MAG: polysaccharide deacetylase family protein [Haloarculaceae archaeon]